MDENKNDEDKNDENKNDENYGNISGCAAKRNEIRSVLNAFLLQPIIDLMTSYVFDKDIEYICTFVYSGFFEYPNRTLTCVTPTIILDGIIYKLESVELSTTIFLFIYDNSTKKLVHSTPLANCGMRLRNWDTICVPSLLNNNNNIAADKISDKIFVSSCVEDNIYVFCTMTGKMLYVLRNLSESKFYGHSMSYPYRIKLTNNNKTIALLTIDPRLKKRFIKFIDIDKSCEKIAAYSHNASVIDPNECRVVSYDCYFNDWGGIFDFHIDGSTIYLFDANTIFTFDMNSKKIIHSTKQSAMKILNNNVFIYNNEKYTTGQNGYEIVVCDSNNNDIGETKLLECVKFENNQSCSEYLLKNFMHFGIHRSWSDTDDNNLYLGTHQIASMSINGNVTRKSETESTIGVTIMTNSKKLWNFDFTNNPGAINFVVNAISALYSSNQLCLPNSRVDDEDDEGDELSIPQDSVRRPSGAESITRINQVFPEFDSLYLFQRHIFFEGHPTASEIVGIENGKIYVRYGNDLVVIGR